MNITKELSELKTKIDSATKEMIKLQGALEQMASRLKKEFGVNDLDQAEKKLADMEKELNQSESDLGKGIANLKAMMP